jgi:hypothetical protein
MVGREGVLMDEVCFMPIDTTGHILLTPVNPLLVMGKIFWSFIDAGFEPATFQSY